MTKLSQQHCEPVSVLLNESQISVYLAELNATWEYHQNSQSISRDFHFKNYYETMAFVNASAWIAHQQDHHPDLLVTYNTCSVTFTTHSVKGLSVNDFICAARINEITHL